VDSATELPLFPLRTVLFPGGELQLRVFEPRYLDMVKHCGRSGSGFGICLILDGEEVGRPATPAAFGTLAQIVDFHADDGGLLGLKVRGECRFHVRRSRVRDNGLIVAEVERLPEPPPHPVAAEHGLLATLLERLIERFGGPHAQAERACYDDAAWVGYRLGEMLPFSPAERQELLQCGDDHARLECIVRRLPQFQEA
jgi:Lon protease-like protein